MVCIEFHHASNSNTLSSITCRTMLGCTLSFVALCIGMCYTTNFVALHCVTLHLNLLWYATSFVAQHCVALQVLLYYIALRCKLCCATLHCTISSTSLWALLQLCCVVLSYDFVVLCCITNFIVLCYEVC
jgi:hypothetical protein